MFFLYIIVFFFSITYPIAYSNYSQNNLCLFSPIQLLVWGDECCLFLGYNLSLLVLQCIDLYKLKIYSYKCIYNAGQVNYGFILFMWDLLSTNPKDVWTKDTCFYFCSYDLLGLEGLAQSLCIFIGKDDVPNYKFLDLPINFMLNMHVKTTV